VVNIEHDYNPSGLLSIDYLILDNSFEIGVDHWFYMYGSSDYKQTDFSMTYYLENSGYAWLNFL